MEKSYSYFVTLFVARFHAYLIQRDQKLIDVLDKKLINMQDLITLDNFIKMVKRFCPQLNSMQIKDMFTQFNPHQSELKTSSFIKSFQAITNKLPKTMKKEKDSIRQQQKQIAIIGLKKLQIFVQNSDAEQLFNECDLSGSGKLNVQQFNKLFFISQIPEFKQHVIRKILLQMIFKNFGQGISKQNFFSLFRIDLAKQKQKLNQLNQIKIKPNNPLVLPNKLATLKENVGQRQKSNNLFKKNHNANNAASYEAKKLNSTDEKQKNEKQLQIRSTHDILHTNLYNLLPNSMKYFRNGEPELQDMNFMQLLQQHLKNKKTFVDHFNPKTHLGKYVLASQIFKGNNYSLFQMAPSIIHRQKSRIGIARELEPKDIIQGRIGDCYFLSAIASIVSLYPEMIAERFLVNCNQSHMLGVKLFIDGQWIIFQTDDRFPAQNGNPIFAKPHGKQIWVMLLQKCWAKAHMQYKSIQSGTPRQGFLSLTGAPSEYINLDDIEQNQKIKEILQESNNKRYMTTVSGNDYLSSLSREQQTKIGLVSDHSYSFLKLIKIGNETIFKLRNPWGNQIWKGKWSFRSDAWTPELRNKFNYKQPSDDGSFYIDYKDFIKYFGNIVICRANPTFLHSSIKTSFDSKKSNYFEFTIQQQSSFTFTIYQTSKRINKNSNYQFSPARIIILKRVGQRLQYVGSMNKNAYDCGVQVNLTPGNYVMAAKIKWKSNDFGNEAVISSYGNQRISIQLINRSINIQFKRDMILSFMKMFPGQIKKYQNIKIPEAFNQKYLDIKRGIGYIKYCNNSKIKGFQTTVSMNLKGIKVIKPNKIPQTFIMKTGSQYVVGFFINPEGYSYQSSESIKYLS